MGEAECASVRLLCPPTQCRMQEADAERLFQYLDVCVSVLGGRGLQTGVTRLRL